MCRKLSLRPSAVVGRESLSRNVDIPNFAIRYRCVEPKRYWMYDFQRQDTMPKVFTTSGVSTMTCGAMMW
jgi:hypothetical protein